MSLNTTHFFTVVVEMTVNFKRFSHLIVPLANPSRIFVSGMLSQTSGDSFVALVISEFELASV